MKRHSVKGLCPLCQQERKLVRSHIIPEFFVRAIRNEDGRALGFWSSRPLARFVQQAFTYRLLCAGCDNFLNTEYETPFLAFWRQAVPGVAWGRNYLLTVPDYARFKIFLLSVLWRAGVCRDGEFARVDLGGHEPVLRHMIRNCDPLSIHDFPILGAMLLVPDSLQITHTLISPYATEWEGSRGYMIGFGSCLWHFLLRREPLHQRAHEWILMEDGRIGFPLLHLNQLGNVNSIFNGYLEVATAKGWRIPWLNNDSAA